MFEVIDTHAHLDEIADLQAALKDARNVGVTAIIAVGSNHRSNQRILEICLEHPAIVYPALGLHPWELGNLEPHHIESTLKFIEEKTGGVVAIGEIGLDYDKRVTKMAPKELQKEVFKRLLFQARQEAKPVIVHSRYAWKDSFEIVKETGIKKAVFHWFTGLSSVLREILQAGYFISATPAAEYHEEHRRAIKETPLERLLLESDCPVIYGRETKYRSTPSHVLRSLKAAAAIKDLGEVTLAEQTTRNAAHFFGLASIYTSC